MKANNDLTKDIISSENDRKQIDIFWTGGFDSTFRIVQLSKCNIVIQPYYISDHRRSESYELNAISKITELLKNHKETKCVFGELIIVNQEDRVNAPEVTQAWNELRAKDFFGTQYDWLGCFATKHKGIELSVHEDDKAVILLNKYGKLREVSDPDIGSYWVLDEESTSKELAALFENYHLPLVHWTKVQMKEYYLQNGYADIMNQTWFCHHPRKGQPCGTCNPCIYTIEEGLKERFSKSALLRYHVKKFADSVRRS